MISAWMRRFFSRAESADCSVRPEELIDGKAFKYKIYPCERTHHVMPSDTFNATVCETLDGQTVYEQTFSEEIDKHMEINAVAVFRFKDAFGLENGIGAAFGKAKK